MSKCPFCTSQCGNSHCSYTEKDVLTQAIEAGLRPTWMKVTRDQAREINEVYYNNLAIFQGIEAIDFVDAYKVYIDSQFICKIQIA